MSRLTKRRRFTPLLAGENSLVPDADGDLGDGTAPGGGESGVVWPASLDINLIFRVESDDFDANANLDSITQWNDKSGLDNHFLTQAAAYDPWTDAVITLNGHNTVRFQTSTKVRHLRRSSWNSAPGTPWTEQEILVIGIKDADPPTAAGNGSPFKFNNGTDGSHVTLNGSGDVYENFGNAARPNSGNPATSLTSWLGYNVRATQVLGTQVARQIIVGSEVLENTAGGGIWQQATPGAQIMLGGSFAGNYTDPTYPQYSWGGNIAAVYMWSAVLPGALRATLATYINDKWGVTIPSS